MKHVYVLLLCVFGFPTNLMTATHDNPNLRPISEWTLISDRTLATVYNAVPEQCNGDCLRTASLFRINPDTIESDRIMAMERTMMREYGIQYGDKVRIEGTGKYDGEWQVQDTMNRRFAGQHRIDLLVPSNIRHGKWTNIKVYIKTSYSYNQ